MDAVAFEIYSNADVGPWQGFAPNPHTSARMVVSALDRRLFISVEAILH